MGDKTEMGCPKCGEELRERTYEEIMSELMENHGMSRMMAHLVFIPRTGGMMRWWCEGCELEFGQYRLLEHAFSVVPAEEEGDGRP